jgi:hypothetical protein
MYAWICNRILTYLKTEYGAKAVEAKTSGEKIKVLFRLGSFHIPL